MGTLGTVVLVTAAAGVGGTGLGGGAACLLRRRSDRMVSLMLSLKQGPMVGTITGTMSFGPTCSWHKSSLPDRSTLGR